MPKNPIIDELVAHLQSGRQVGKIQPEFSSKPNKNVTFHFADGTQAVLQTTSDHDTFIRWWKDLDRFIRMVRKVQDLEGSNDRE